MLGLRVLAMLAFTFAGKTVAEPATSHPTIVKIDSGYLRGVVVGDIASFRGIPYAAPPVGELRWRMPQPVKPWKGVLLVDRFGPACMQPSNIPKSEDCLTLNVWRPTDGFDAPLPVMVWIHGGGLMSGGGGTSGDLDAPAKQGVVVVSMNYRLGPLGFFAHPALTTEAPDDVRGNYGYMDQRASLLWVQRNIAAFGGDPAKVTIFGESAGGGSVMIHLTSPMSQGLFRAAVMESPSPTSRANVGGLTEIAHAEALAIDYARSFRIADKGAEGLKALRALPAEKFVKGVPALENASLSAGNPRSGFAGPIHDGKFVVESPEAALASGLQAMVPVIIGANDRDLGFGSANSKNGLFAIFGPNAAEASKIYDPNGDRSLDELKQQVFADKWMTEPARHLADEMARAGQPAWLYRFSYVAKALRGKLKGAIHNSETPYVFNNPAAVLGNKVTPADVAMANVMSAYWVSFAKTGDPNGGGRPQWPRHDAATDTVMNFTNRGVFAQPDPIKARLDLWQNVWSGGH